MNLRSMYDDGAEDFRQDQMEEVRKLERQAYAQANACRRMMERYNKSQDEDALHWAAVLRRECIAKYDQAANLRARYGRRGDR